MKFPKRAITVMDECWGIPLHVFWDVSGEDFKRVMVEGYNADADDIEHDGDGFFIPQTDGNGVVHGFIALDNGAFTGSPIQYSILAHEISHVVFFFLKRAGLKLSSKSEESFSYLLGSLVHRCATKMLETERLLKLAEKKKRLARKK